MIYRELMTTEEYKKADAVEIINQDCISSDLKEEELYETQVTGYNLCFDNTLEVSIKE